MKAVIAYDESVLQLVHYLRARQRKDIQQIVRQSRIEEHRHGSDVGNRRKIVAVVTAQKEEGKIGGEGGHPPRQQYKALPPLLPAAVPDPPKEEPEAQKNTDIIEGGTQMVGNAVGVLDTGDRSVCAVHISAYCSRTRETPARRA
jgi:hypothetical protein